MATNTDVLISIKAQDNASAVIQNVGGELKGLGKNLDNAGGKFGDLKGTALVAGAALAGVGVAATAMAKSFVDAAGFVEMQRTAFRTLIGDAILAEKTYRDLVDFAAKTPFEIPQILEQSKRLLAMGTSAKDLTKVFGMLGDVASGVGMEKLPQLVLAFGQIQAKGRLMGTELRQLTEAGFNLADAMGISNAKLEELVEDKAVKFEDVRKAFERVTGEGGRFNGMMQELAKTTPGQLSNLNDNLFKLRAALGDALLPAVNKLIQAIMPLVEQFADFAKRNPKLVATIMAIALGIGVLGSAILVITGIITAASAIFTVFGAILGAITLPMVLIGAAILALIGIGYLLVKNWDTIKEKASSIWASVTATFSSAVSNVSNFINSMIASIAGMVNSIVNFFMVTIPAAVNSVITWFSLLPQRVMAFLNNLFLVQIPFAIGFLAGFLSVVIPAMINSIVAWFQSLPVLIPQLIEQMKAFVITSFTNLWNEAVVIVTNMANSIVTWFTQLKTNAINLWEQTKQGIIQKITQIWGWISSEVPTWPGRIKEFLSTLPGIVHDILERVYQSFLDRLSAAWGVVSGFKDRVVDAFNAIVSAVGRAIDALKRGFEAGKESGGRFHFATGGIVPGAIGEPVPIVAHGGEKITPAPAGGGSSGGGLNLTVQIGLYAGTETEKRNIARDLYAALLQVATSQNKTVAQLMGG